MGEPAKSTGGGRDFRTELSHMLGKLETLPTLPTIVYELNRLINDPMSSASDISKVMERDQSLTAKVLRLVNSAYYAIPGGVTNLQRAIAYLGYDTINQLVMSATVFQTLNKSQLARFDLGAFWKHAMGVAMAAETIAKWTKHKNPSDCFTCGLLHDLGKVALYQVAPKILDEVVQKAQKEGISVIEAENQLEGVPHTVVGAMLAKLWKLPAIIENSVLYHHEFDVKKRSTLSADLNQAIDIVFLGNSMIHELQFGDSGHNQKIPADEILLKRLNLNSAQMPLVMKDVARVLTNADDFLKIIAG
jgi:putative nucleotidyltransferase with HDIG domain